jgi:hypothetical protein
MDIKKEMKEMEREGNMCIACTNKCKSNGE